MGPGDESGLPAAPQPPPAKNTSAVTKRAAVLATISRCGPIVDRCSLGTDQGYNVCTNASLFAPAPHPRTEPGAKKLFYCFDQPKCSQRSFAGGRRKRRSGKLRKLRYRLSTR